MTKTTQDLWVEATRSFIITATVQCAAAIGAARIEVSAEGMTDFAGTLTAENIAKAVEAVEETELAEIILYTADGSRAWLSCIYDWGNDPQEGVRDYGASEALYAKIDPIMSRLYKEDA